MAKKYLHTSQVARSVGVHPNTVRLYEEWNFLPHVPRAPNGYRMFSQTHIDHMKLARMAMRFTWMGGSIRKMTLSIVYLAAEKYYETALERAFALKATIQIEQGYAHDAAEILEQWALGYVVEDPLPAALTIGQAAKVLDVTTEMLRNWERNNLIRVPRSPNNGYRQYGPTEISHLRVIRALRKAGYSMMSILRMTIALGQGQRHQLKQVLDTPRPDEDVFVATDHWITTLDELAQTSQAIIDLLEDMIAKQSNKPLGESTLQ